MNPHEDQLREAFASHEHLAPGLGEVYRGSQELFRRYRRRRTGSRVVGGAMLGASLLAAGTNLPASLLPGAPAPTPKTTATITTPPIETPSTIPTNLTNAELQRDLHAFESAGYTPEDAQQLAELWHVKTTDIVIVKAEAGRQLLAGHTLPIPLHPGATTTTPPETPQQKADNRAFAAFFNAGNNWNDAVRLAKLWHLPDPAEAKLKGGRLLESGHRLPG